MTETTKKQIETIKYENNSLLNRLYYLIKEQNKYIDKMKENQTIIDRFLTKDSEV